MFIFIYVEVVEVEEVELDGLVDAVQTVQQCQVERGRSEGRIPAEQRSQVGQRGNFSTQYAPSAQTS